MKLSSFLCNIPRITRAGKPLIDSHLATRVPPALGSRSQVLIVEIPNVRLVHTRTCGGSAASIVAVIHPVPRPFMRSVVPDASGPAISTASPWENQRGISSKA
jgi:hypothetical protein